MKVLAALVDTSEPNRSSDSEIVQIELLLDGRQVDDAERADLRRCRSGRRCRPPCIASQVRWMVRPTPVSPTNMWCASSVSMNRQVRDSGSKPDCARLSSCILPSRSVKKVNMKNDSQSGVASLKAPSMRGLSGVAGAALQQFLRLLAAVAAEIFLQDIDHRPEVAAFLDIDLEDVAQVVERRRGLAEIALLLDRGRLGVALDDDEAAQHRAIFAGHVLPGRLAVVAAERDVAALFLRREQNAPAVFRHFHVVELRPALGIDADRGAQIDQRLLEAFRPHVHPPVDVARMPALERAQHLPVLGEIDVVRDLGRVVDAVDHRMACLRSPISLSYSRVSKTGFWPVP